MNKLIKIILSLDNPNKIKRIIVVKTDGIERYTTEDLTQKSLREIYSEYVLILKEEYKEELNGLSKQEKINKLASMNKIERNENNLITYMNYFSDENKAIIYYEDGMIKERQIGKSNFLELIFDLCKTYGIFYNKNSLNNTFNVLENMGLIKRNIKNNNLKNVIKSNKIKNLKINHRILSSIIAALMIGGIFGGIKLNKSNSNINDNPKEMKIEILPKETPFDEELMNKLLFQKYTKQFINKYLPNKEIYELIEYIISRDISLEKVNNSIVNIQKIISDTIINLKNNNYLNNVEISPYLTEMNVNNDKFIIINTNKGYLNILKEEGKQDNDDCFECSIAYADSIFDDSESFSKTGVRMDKNVVVTENEQKVLQIIAKELLEGRTSIIRVNGARGGRHFVLVVGLRKDYDKDNLKQSDFLIADPASAVLKILNTEFGGQKRYLFKAEDDINWQNREGDSLGYMIALANNIEEYSSQDVKKGIVPWVTYVPKEI